MALIISETNAITGKTIEREMNAEELAQHENDQQQAEILKQKELNKESARQALLDKLGITQEEAHLLLGGN